MFEESDKTESMTEVIQHRKIEVSTKHLQGGGALRTKDVPPVQSLSFSCSFLANILPNNGVWRQNHGLAPPLGNPGSVIAR